MARRRLSLGQAALGSVVACAAMAYGLAFSAPWGLFAIPPAVFSLFWSIERLPPRLVGILRAAGWLLTAAVALLPGLLMIQAIGDGDGHRAAILGGAALLLLSAFHLLWAPTWAISTSIAVLVTSSLSYREPGLPYVFGGAALSLVFWLAAGRTLRWAPMLALLAVAAAVATVLGFLLPAAQPWVEGKMSELATRSNARAGLSTTSRLGDVEQLGLSARVALRMWADAPRYLRARVFTRYANRGWSGGTPRQRLKPGAGLEELPGVTWARPGATSYRARILQEVLVRDALPVPPDVRLARLGADAPWVDDAGVLTPIGPPPHLYAVACGDRTDGGAPGDCLEVPEGLDPRLKELAASFTGTPEERVHRTLGELEARCVYALDVGAFQSEDPVGEFVFDKRRGYCEYFASAAALLLRLQKIPARYVVGYSVRPSNYEGGHYVVREGDAHAWVEAWLPGRGWVELDPTPGAQFEAMRTGLRGTGLWERIKAWCSETFALFQQGARLSALLRVAATGGTLLGLVLAWRFLKSFKLKPKVKAPERPPLPAGPRELLKALDVAWAKAGHPRPASRAPLEHLAKMPSPVGEAAVRALYRCVYGGASLSDVELAALRTSVDAAAGPAPRTR